MEVLIELVMVMVVVVVEKVEKVALPPCRPKPLEVESWDVGHGA